MKTLIFSQKSLLWLVFQLQSYITLTGAYDISDEQYLAGLSTVSEDINVSNTGTFVVSHSPSVTIDSDTITNDGNLCIGTTSSSSDMSISLDAGTLNNKADGRLVISNGINSGQTSSVNLNTLNNEGYLRMELKDDGETFAVSDSFVNSGFIALKPVNPTDWVVLGLTTPSTGIVNSGTIDVSGTDVIFDHPITGGGCVMASGHSQMVINTDYENDQTFWLGDSDDHYTAIFLTGTTKYIPKIRGYGGYHYIGLGEPLVENTGPATVLYNTTTGIVQVTTAGQTYTIDIGTGYNATKVTTVTLVHSGGNPPNKVLVYYDDSVTFPRPSICAVDESFTMGTCDPTFTVPPPYTTTLSSETDIISYYSTTDSSGFEVTATTTILVTQSSTSSSIPSSSSTNLEISSSTRIPELSSSTNTEETTVNTESSSKCVVMKTETGYGQTINATKYIYTTIASIDAPVTLSSFVTTYYETKSASA
ncbi:uncharacterized protein NDAI_0G01810 [Naumovozyma dairenensis CBS 421]|uniref:Hyphally-regulated cell wall protein N-terminal domain-containing protein n=1 Tax=Naumovozyma dairenensis (strain ATCC 10597 / BCRC 20456 / CBS 421 / NBRC 0211 / NRRL Y-12639) TaxID=1071378 RepID=G0WDU6_NAUDC|nr:hypothetical protein NDAI_0G01810 [Naumovozyma dairenensis CBS 421]CCD25957.2 hypothetical protein NDAI_0G01810 [Naumovozyma dairenensis CBS 421]